MIESLTLKKDIIKKEPIKFKDQSTKAFIPKLPLFKANKTFNFKPGINVIYGGNGEGKTTLLNMLATTLGCLQGGKSYYTNTWLGDLDDTICLQVSYSDAKDGGIELNYEMGHYHMIPFIDVKHDGQSAFYCDPRKLRGLRHNGAAFDHDFFDELKKDGKERSSTGKKNKSRMEDIMNVLSCSESVEPTSIPFQKYLKEDLENVHNEQVRDLIKPNISVGAKTLMIDEPENALDFVSQRAFFKLLKENENRDDLQIIMITHSPLVFMLENVNYITSDKSMLEYQQQLVKDGNFFNANF